jgi:hypothetical protein
MICPTCKGERTIAVFSRFAGEGYAGEFHDEPCDDCEDGFADGPTDCAICSETLDDDGTCPIGCEPERRAA